METLELAMNMNRGVMLSPVQEDEYREILLGASEGTKEAHCNLIAFEEAFYELLQDRYIFGGMASRYEWHDFTDMYFKQYLNSMVHC
jgi:hypothetical protein